MERRIARYAARHRAFVTIVRPFSMLVRDGGKKGKILCDWSTFTFTCYMMHVHQTSEAPKYFIAHVQMRAFQTLPA